MTHLVEALRTLGIDGDVSLAGRWVTVWGERCRMHVVEAPWGGGYYTWCDDPAERAVERYRDPIAAVQAGLWRMAGCGSEGQADD